MRKCPFCKAEIEENARFCLYCMKPLGEKEIIPPPKEKKRWWLLAVAIILFLAVFVAIIWLTGRQGEEADPSTGNSSNTGDSSQTGAASGETDPNHDATIEDPGTTPAGKPGGNVSPGPNQDTVPTVPSGAIRPTVPAQPSSTQSSNATQPTTQPTTSTQPTTPTQPSTPTQPTTPTQPSTPTQPTTPPVTQSVFKYRAAQVGDDSQVLRPEEDDIVITGVNTNASVYHIPSYIDGKRVIAVISGAFTGSGAQTVYIGSGIRSVQKDAFRGCAIKHIYFTHNIYLAEIPDGVTIHCPLNCTNRSGGKYSELADYYGFTYEEWNG